MNTRRAKTLQIPLWLIFGSFLSAAVQVRLALPLKLGEYFERANVARTFAERAEFADPFTSLPTGPTAHLSPIYPIFLGGVLRVFGETAGGALFLTALCVLAHALYPILLFLLARQILADGVVPLVVGLFAFAVPHIPPMIQVEVIYLIDLMLLSFILTWRFSDSGFSSGRHALLAGLLGGICTLLNAAAVVIWFLWIGYLYWKSNVRGLRLLRSVVLFVVSFSATLAPWVVRNKLIFGEPIVLRGNLGLEFAVSNRDGAASSLSQNLSSGIQNRFHPNFNVEEAKLVVQLGEVDYNTHKWKEAIDWVMGNPTDFAWLTAKRFTLFWFPAWADAAPPYIASLWVFAALIPLALVMLWREKHPFVFFTLAVYAAYPTIYYLIQASILYTLPIVWLHVVCAGYLVASIPMIRRLFSESVASESGL